MATPPAENPATINPIKRLKLINQIRKWSHHFDRKDSLSFLEDTEKIPDQLWPEGHLLLGLPELLRGAVLGYQKNRDI